MLRAWLHVGIDPRIGRIAGRSAPVLVLDEAAHSDSSRGIRTGSAGVRAWTGWRNGREISEVHGVDAIMPVFATERTARQRVLHDVVELPVAGEHFQFSVVEQVVSATDSRRHLLSE